MVVFYIYSIEKNEINPIIKFPYNMNMDNIMNFEQILSFLTTNDWYQVDQSNEFLSKSDIFLKFTLGNWERVQSDEALPSNISPFFRQLKDRQINNSIASCFVEFQYKNQLLRKVQLFRFTGVKESDRDVVQKVYFSKPSSQSSNDPIADPFTLTLIKLMNDENGLNNIKYAFGEIK